MLPAESASTAATYWDKLLRHHWQALEKEEGAPNHVGEPFPSFCCAALQVLLRRLLRMMSEARPYYVRAWPQYLKFGAASLSGATQV